ncbi:MAG: hypothetical protein M0Q91_07745 [Methanoregula sp.]|jgi:hypothetical protein|nr:hypothetical protein [Methanoregula sp.]
MPRDDLYQYRRGTTAAWAAANPVLAVGEPGIDTDLKIIKFGDGTTAWLSLAAWAAQAGTIAVWTEVTGTTQAIAINTAYIANNAGLVTLTLPATVPVGSVIRIIGKGAGGWLIAQRANQYIFMNGSTTTTGITGSLASTATHDCVELVCTVADVGFTAISSMGNLTVV